MHKHKHCISCHLATECTLWVHQCTLLPWPNQLATQIHYRPNIVGKQCPSPPPPPPPPPPPHTHTHTHTHTQTHTHPNFACCGGNFSVFRSKSVFILLCTLHNYSYVYLLVYPIYAPFLIYALHIGRVTNLVVRANSTCMIYQSSLHKLSHSYRPDVVKIATWVNTSCGVDLCLYSSQR